MRREYNLKHLRTMPKRLSALLAAIVLLFGVVFPLLLPKQASAASQLQQRSLKLSSSANGSITTDKAGNAIAAGAGGNGQKTQEVFTFKLQTTGNVGSVLIVYCDDPIPEDTCNTPTGFTAANVASVTQSGWTGGAFSLDTSTNLTAQNCDNGRVRCIALKRTSAGGETANTTVTLTFGGTGSDYITNPTTDNYAFFARIRTYSDTGWTLANLQDYGSVAGSTAQQIDITAKVKEVLNFSVADVTGLTAPGTTGCAALGAGTNGQITLGDANGVLDFNVAWDARSYFRLSTNSNFGATVYYSGDTLKNGSNTISAAGTTAVLSAPGTSQFGLGLDSSDTQGGNGYSLSRLVPTAQYNSSNGAINPPGIAAKFALDTGSTSTPVALAASTAPTGPVGCETGAIRYIGNISTSTPAGIYYTTITYIATSSF